MIQVNLERCTGCGVCVSACRVEAISVIQNHAVIDVFRCDQCGDCLSTCPQRALSSVPSAVPAVGERPLLLPAPLAPVAVPAARRGSATWRANILPLLGGLATVAMRELVPRVVAALAHSSTQSPAGRAAAVGQHLRRRYRHRSRERS